MTDRPPGRERESGPAVTPGRPITTSSPPSTPRSHANSRLADGAVSERQRRAVLALSDERDAQLRLRLRAWREGRRAGYDAGWRDGFVAAVDGYKAAQQKAVRDLDLYLRRWGGPRGDFARPRPGDYPGGPVDFYGRRRS
jgi:hypothetical protein